VNYADKNIFLNNADKGNHIQDDIENDHAGSDETAKNDLWLPAFKNMADNSADDCSIYVTMPQGGAHMMMMMSAQEAGWQVKHELIWVKNNHVLGRVDYLYKHEPILFGWKDKHKFYGNGEHTKSVWEIPKPQKSDLHPTMKPIALIANALLNSSQEGDNILDVFGGSGSTLIACEQLNRKCYMMEMSPKYVDVIIKRWEEYTGKKAVKIA
jgi:site-specific DNA-methyltransferase (adenine-specific)